MEFVVILIILAVLWILFWYIKVSNKVSAALLKIEEAKSGIEIQLQKRYSTLTQSLELAKGYAKHEQELFIGLRTVGKNITVDEINECVKNQNQCLGKISALSESYPELKSLEMFTNLQKQLSEENAQFAAAKRAFNANVTAYNKFVVTVPDNVVCSMRGLSKEKYIEGENVQDMKNISMSWNQ